MLTLLLFNIYSLHFVLFYTLELFYCIFFFRKTRTKMRNPIMGWKLIYKNNSKTNNNFQLENVLLLILIKTVIIIFFCVAICLWLWRRRNTNRMTEIKRGEKGGVREDKVRKKKMKEIAFGTWINKVYSTLSYKKKNSIVSIQ